MHNAQEYFSKDVMTSGNIISKFIFSKYNFMIIYEKHPNFFIGTWSLVCFTISCPLPIYLLFLLWYFYNCTICIQMADSRKFLSEFKMLKSQTFLCSFLSFLFPIQYGSFFLI
ncbi:hypothetical protein VIGAN_02229200 [Vigna angularis var. angularis]|uniref:Uncharacterized protein n=1 Tax=Vigna angularis var. angularis TaxID=157739 RepID=A0A0S3RFJ2_PHAAN|nr:hypothetical protein VIGAN_02229200 [Vigna angularis var. angularis]